MTESYMRGIVVGIIIVIYATFYIINRAKKPKNKEQYIRKIQMYYARKNMKKTIELSMEALNRFQLDIEDKVTVLIAIANSNYELKNYVDAIMYYNEAFNITFIHKKEYHYSECFIYALDCLIKLDKLEKAKALFNKIIYSKEENKEFRKLIVFAKKNSLI
ncbi:hypothetical protein [Clostridium fungisolvens]|uniref:Tetratricopeptide repeat protein n=1 Tax=Clostridium fungisolvens TaxID=1604897 RepID=A0A6V8SCL4_9CLOT|nr:hypothetical protein [Clostridium fungisolvens]GFP74302.1 hypothetical protein bsdtw1_00348 [Clostridium fungisolvens]